MKNATATDNARPVTAANISQSFRRHARVELNERSPLVPGTAMRQMSAIMTAGAASAARARTVTLTVCGLAGKDIARSTREKGRRSGDTKLSPPPTTAKSLGLPSASYMSISVHVSEQDTYTMMIQSSAYEATTRLLGISSVGRSLKIPRNRGILTADVTGCAVLQVHGSEFPNEGPSIYLE